MVEAEGESVRIAQKLQDANSLLLVVQDLAVKEKLKEVQELLLRNADIIKALENNNNTSVSTSSAAESALELNANIKKVVRIYGEMESMAKKQ